MVCKLKALIETTESDEVLQFYLDYSRDLILSYCNLDEIPKELENVLIFLSLEIYKASDNKKSVSMGDVSFEFKDSTVLLQYKGILNRFRRLRW